MEYTIVGSLAAIFTAILTVKKRALTFSAAIEAMVLIIFSCLCGKWFGLVFLLCMYFTVAIVDRVLKNKTSSIFDKMNKKHGARDHIQVAVNGVSALICIILFGITKLQIFAIGYAVALTESFADSIASDVGVMSKSDPISICRFQKVPRGLSGGISLLGTTASLIATIFGAVLYYAFFNNAFEAFCVLAFSFLGCIIDSILGDVLQEKFICLKCNMLTEKPEHCGEKTIYKAGIKGLDNCLVNLLSNIVSTLLCLLILW